MWVFLIILSIFMGIVYRKQFYDFVKQVQADCSKLLDNPNLSPEMMMEILNREAELVKMANEKDTEIR